MGNAFKVRTKKKSGVKRQGGLFPGKFISKPNVKLCSYRGCLRKAKYIIPFDDKISYYCEKHYAEFYSKWKAGEKRALIE
jgi:hypothetical protein